ncbi:hypothetical protein F2Q69_00061403 [Brassica cretica]|uniref:Uncharacterized protein n=1 Tax=Brassica cretica TaxID=69181 RepID=A0A8S9REF9_BRACR|nr:hypothetical protein F2Q69_00061403 [Brassica cretica]
MLISWVQQQKSSLTAAYFKNILGETDLFESPSTVDSLKELLPFRCSDIQQAYLRRVQGQMGTVSSSCVLLGIL